MPLVEARAPSAAKAQRGATGATAARENRKSEHWFFNSSLFERWRTRSTLGVDALSLDAPRGEVKLRFVDPRRASEVAALTAAQREANLAAAEELLESGVG